ncbi:hypothetical protein [Bradyrhizobium sp. OAE829]|uniref:hypothetical protein n=1 Tax=Bradyrhizobium sp. OAE829 TaxID=2663807 RepID=UPI0019E3A28E
MPVQAAPARAFFGLPLKFAPHVKAPHSGSRAQHKFRKNPFIRRLSSLQSWAPMPTRSCCIFTPRWLKKSGLSFRDALAAKKAQGAKLGGLNARGIANRVEALERAEQLRPILAELAGTSARCTLRRIATTLDQVSDIRLLHLARLDDGGRIMACLKAMLRAVGSARMSDYQDAEAMLEEFRPLVDAARRQSFN